MNMNIIIREVRRGDYDDLVRFLAENNMSEITRYFHPFPLTPETAHFIACQLHQDKYYAAFLDNQIVGLSMLRGWDEGFETPSFGIMVDRQMYGKGIGRRLLEYTLEQADKLHCERVRLTVYASNANAIHLYQDVGFYEVSRTSVMIGDKIDEKIVMFKDFA